MKGFLKYGMLSGIFGLLGMTVCGIADVNTELSPIAEVTTLQGTVEIKRANADHWEPADIRMALRKGDMLHVAADSRAAILMLKDRVIRLNEHTTVTIIGSSEKKHPFRRLREGLARFFGVHPRNLNVETPFVNAVLQGAFFTPPE